MQLTTEISFVKEEGKIIQDVEYLGYVTGLSGHVFEIHVHKNNLLNTGKIHVYNKKGFGIWSHQYTSSKISQEYLEGLFNVHLSLDDVKLEVVGFNKMIHLLDIDDLLFKGGEIRDDYLSLRNPLPNTVDNTRTLLRTNTPVEFIPTIKLFDGSLVVEFKEDNNTYKLFSVVNGGLYKSTIIFNDKFINVLSPASAVCKHTIQDLITRDRLSVLVHRYNPYLYIMYISVTGNSPMTHAVAFNLK